MMYAPIRLQNNLLILDEIYRDNIMVTAKLLCCGGCDFDIGYHGVLHTGFLGGQSITDSNGVVAFMAVCKNCGKEILVFDSRCDGYDGCAMPSSILLPVPDVDVFLCKKCLSNGFSILIKYEYQSKDDLVADGVQEYENAFSWIYITVICSSCNKIYKNLIDIETS